MFNPKRFFETALQTGSLAHAYQFRGRDIGAMYLTALWLAQALNCTSPISANEPCGHCAACHWVMNNAHPGVITISRLTYLTLPPGSAEPDSPEELWRKLNKLPEGTLIKAEQVEMLLQQLSRTADHNRVIIFTDAETRDISQPSAIPPPNDWTSNPANEKKSFHLKPLDQAQFSEASANRFLKTLEEPSPKTLFIFLTSADDGVLATIASRCQLVPFPSAPSAEALVPLPTVDFQGFLKAMLGSRDPYYATELFLAQVVEPTGMSEVQALEALQLALRQQWRGKPVDPKRFANYQRWQQAIDVAAYRLSRKTNVQATLADCFTTLKQA
jgi:hypothetical protein